jgi:hypothetical protein
MKFPQPNTKVSRVLAAFMTSESYNLFEATLELNDHSLHSTVSTLQNSYKIRISRKRESIVGYDGIPVSCCRYWIDLEERMRIRSEIASGKKKALTTSVETIGKGLDTSSGDNTASGNDGQVSFLTMPVKYVRNYFKSIVRF